MVQPHQLPGPSADLWKWQLHARCRGLDSSVFFHPEGERGRVRWRRESRAKAMCRLCPVIEQCREYALDVGEAYGVWGGLSESERELLLRPYLAKEPRTDHGEQQHARIDDAAALIR
ncbi:MAG: WhiB family transcriptional regulator [Mycobacterium sp.]